MIKIDSPISLVFYIYVLLIGYQLLEIRSDWNLFSRFRNITIYGLTLIITLQGIMGLDIIRRYNPYNPEQMNRTDYLQDAILKNDLEEVKRLIAIGYDPFIYSYGNPILLDDYKWFFPASWLGEELRQKSIDRIFWRTKPSIFYFASISGIKGATRPKISFNRKDYLHPYSPEIYPHFDQRIFDYLLNLKPPKQQLQYALEELSTIGNTAALVKIMTYDKDLAPKIRDIENAVQSCFTDVNKILLKRLFKTSINQHQTFRSLYEALGYLETDFSPCSAPIRKYLEQHEKYTTSNRTLLN